MSPQDQDERISKAVKNARVYQAIDTEGALQKTRRKIGFEEDRKSRSVSGPEVFKIAASIIIALGIGWFIYLNQFAPKWTTYISNENILEYKLSDGSLITLNKNSLLRVNQDMTSHRRVQLQGEAFFDVQRDESRPFIIATENVEIQVLGTSCNIRSNPKQVEVSVASGEVRAGEKDQISNSLILTKGEAVMFENSILTFKKHLVDDNYLAWKTGVYTFSNASVKVALSTLAESKGINVQFENRAIENCKITSVFDNQSWEEIMNEFSLIHSLEFVTDQDNVVIVKGGNCE